MSVALPPPTVPDQVDAAAIQGEAAVTKLQFQNVTLHLHGADVIKPSDIATILDTASSLSDVVQLLNQACYIAGYPACRTTYARVGDRVYVLLDLRGVDVVQASPPMARYFEGLAGTAPLTDADLEPRRFLANSHSGRAGLRVQPSIRHEAEGNTVLDIASVEDGHASRISAEFGNPGTRFVGRYLASFEGAVGSRWGDQLTLGWREGLSSVGSNPNDGSYHELTAGISRVTPWGIVGVHHRRVDYDFVTQGFAVDADIRIHDLSWVYPWYATFNQRLLTQIRVERSESATQLVQGPRGQLLDERYTSAEATAFYTRNHAWLGRVVQTDGTLMLRQGLKDRVAQPSGADLDYRLIRPTLTVKIPLTPGWTLATHLIAQFSSDSLPQQAQWVLGGDGSLNAFLPGAATGDEGVLGRFELSTPPFRSHGITVKPALLLAGGTATDNTTGREMRLADIGAKLDLAFGPYFEGAISYAVDLASDNLIRDDADADIYFTLRLKF